MNELNTSTVSNPLNTTTASTDASYTTALNYGSTTNGDSIIFVDHPTVPDDQYSNGLYRGYASYYHSGAQNNPYHNPLAASTLHPTGLVDVSDYRESGEECAFLGCLLSWIPCLGIIVYCLHADAPDTSRRGFWARSSLITGLVVMVLLFMYWNYYTEYYYIVDGGKSVPRRYDQRDRFDGYRRLRG
jgi:hypothetical protein